MPLGGRPSGSPEAADAWAEELAAELADRLESWAIEREKILAKLDVRGARAARAMARSVRIIVRALATFSNANDPERRAVIARLVIVRRDALRLMSSRTNALSQEELQEFLRLSQGENVVEPAPETEERATLSPPQLGPMESHYRDAAKPQADTASNKRWRVPSKRRHSTQPPRSASDQPTGSHSLDAALARESLRSSRAPGAAPSDEAAGGLGDYIARIRRLKDS